VEGRREVWVFGEELAGGARTGVEAWSSSWAAAQRLAFRSSVGGCCCVCCRARIAFAGGGTGGDGCNRRLEENLSMK